MPFGRRMSGAYGKENIMTAFPKNEKDIVDFAEQMIAGFTEHAADFPSVTVAQLTAELANFKEARDLQENMQGQTKIATTAKSEDLDSLISQMRNDLKKAEIDCTDSPQTLAEIGWGPRNEPTPIQAPTEPGALHAISESTGEIRLSWGRPATDPNRPVRNYIIERADAGETGTFGPFSLIETVYNNEAHLLGQPSNLRMLYRIKAANAAGVSLPSNTLLVVLP